ncbi:hypothetical protein HYU23_02515 [Candidatus Woesearchaeota archaeon]|nr:hypothetical protein [Candidatus Woesearchaeota archaeon]
MIELPQICEETGISADYWNYWGVLALHLKDGDYVNVFEKLGKKPIPFYCERFRVKPEEIITDQNRDRIMRLDELVRDSNALPSRYSNQPDDAIQQLKSNVNQVIRIIYGSTEEIWFPEVSQNPDE